MTDYYADFEIMPAPNRYRKLFKPASDGREGSGQVISREVVTEGGRPVITRHDDGRETVAVRETLGSDGMQCFFVMGFGEDGAALRERAAKMMRDDWPEKADLVVGMEPRFDLTDVILIWSRPPP